MELIQSITKELNMFLLPASICCMIFMIPVIIIELIKKILHKK
ncbi:MAG: hypothetical protein OCD02_11320 [Spirochaetaceae bacterium]